MTDPEEEEEARVDILVLVYLEPTDEANLVWCAESPAVPGFYAAEDSLSELMVRAELAVREIVAEDEPDADVVIRWELVGDADSSAPEVAEFDDQLDPYRDRGSHVVTSSRTPVGV